MLNKTHSLTLSFISLLFFVTAGEVLANSSAELKQAKSNILSLIRQNNFAEAQSQTQKLTADFAGHPDLPDTLYWIAERYKWSNRFEDAKRVYQQIVQKHPGSSYAGKAKLGFSRADVLSLIISQNYNQAKVALDKLIADFAGNPELPETVYWVAERYKWENRFEEANRIYQQVIQKYPDSPWAGKAKFGISSAEAMSIVVSQDYDQAKEALDKLIADFAGNPDLPRAILIIGEQYYNKAFRCENEGLDAEAKEHFRRATAIWEEIVTELPDSDITAQAYYYAAGCYSQLGQYPKAIRYYKKVVDNWPEYKYTWNALFLLGRVYEKLGEAGVISISEADLRTKAAYEQIIQNHPDCPAVYAARAWLNSTAELKERTQK